MIIPRRYIDIQTGELHKIIKITQHMKRFKSSRNFITEWEKVFAHYVGRKHAIATGSGRLAMQIILQSLRLEDGSEVIIPSYTLKELIPIIQSLGLIPVPADIDTNTFNITADSVSQRLTKKAKVILATHLFGNPCPIKELIVLAQTNDLKIIEDCAHSIGSGVNGKKTGFFGAAAFFSFETIKPINTYGGGMIVTDDDSLAKCARESVRRLESATSILKKVAASYLERLLFSTSIAFLPLSLLATEKGHKSMTSLYRSIQHAPKIDRQYSEIQAALGLEKIKTLANRISKRLAKAKKLKSLLPQTIQTQRILPGAETNYYFFVVLLPDDASAVRKHLLIRGFDSGIGYEITDNCAVALKYNDCPHIQKIFKRAIHLPVHERMDDYQIERLGKFLKKRYR